ncbi:methylated-DNA--[protein]-cysteine S-methyltransferase [Chitinophaga sp. NPDC101104]|uniref:methylated-DNA--[protein]-cysteine S-methyltransferase n=1 Tax=Chitinophaga sp. NPDC101104 TaxID=3390561 RepID=UPI003CFF708D
MSALYMDSPLGRIMIVETEGYISKVSFIDKEPAPLLQDDTVQPGDQPTEAAIPFHYETSIQQAFPAESPTPLLRECAAQLEAYFRKDLRAFDLPLRQEGSPFQQLVWQNLLTIPFGETITYLALAKRLGNVKSIRAAGTANGRNNIAIIVPCHRVIGSGGALTGYAGGIWRKQFLLDLEKGGLLF